MKLRNRLIAAIIGIAASVPAFAQQYPSKPVRVIIGYGAGGVTDLLNRLMADELGKRLGQPFVVENRPGASGLVAATAVKSSAPDGYTLYGGSVSDFSPVFLKAGIVASKELSPIAGMVAGDWYLYVPTSLGVNNLKELQAWAKNNPGKFRFAGVAATNSMFMAFIANRMGFRMENIPYKTSDQAIAAMLSGDAHASFNAASGHIGHVQAGKLKAIATLGPQRTSVIPDALTAMEQGVQLDIRFRQGLWGPLGVPADVANRIGGAVQDALKQPEVAERISKMSLLPGYVAPQASIRSYDDELKVLTEAAGLINLQPQ